MSRRFPVVTKALYIPTSALFLVFVLLLCLPPLIASADIGPKPTASFHFVWEIDSEPVIVEGILLQCKDSECADSYPMEERGPQHFTCSEKYCDSMAYGYSRYAKLVVTFSDGVTRESNIFGKKYDKSQYEVIVHTSDLTVTEARGTNHAFISPDTFDSLFRWLEIILGLLVLIVLLAIIIFTVVKTKDRPLEYASAKIPCLSIWIITLPVCVIGIVFARTLPLTIIIEGFIISIYILIKKYRWFPWVTVITLGNLFTQVLYLTMLSVVGSWGPPFILMVFLEIFTWLFEALLIHLALRRQDSIPASLGISFLINIVSMGIGLLLPM